MHTLSIDIETYSDIDLTKCGVYKYADSPNFEILLIAYSVDDGPTILLDLTDASSKGERELLSMLWDSKYIKTAFNANFEITCLSAYYEHELDPAQWRCTKVQAMQMGLPGNLDGVAKALKLSAQKDKRGKDLINYFSKPCKPTKTNGQRTRNLPGHAPEKWMEFCDYCIQDVVVEKAIKEKLAKYPIHPSEQRLWELDQRIISGGVLVDQTLVDHAVECALQNNERLMEKAQRITGLSNPNSVSQLKTWLEEAEGAEVDSLNKATVKDLLGLDLSDQTRELLEIRQELGKTSVKKYEAMQRAVCSDGRVRGLLEFYGANRTGRWAGRLVQVQNLPQNKLQDLGEARELVRGGHYDTLEMLFGNVPGTLSQLIRTAFIASPGNRFIVADFSAIEARVIAWLAGEQWRLDVFDSHGKIYEASAAQMFKVPIESIGKTSPLRQKGKISELALGYQGGPNALISMGALNMGLTEEELKPIVDLWRAANPKIVKLWQDCESAAIRAIRDGGANMQFGIEFRYKDGSLFVKLPSGRSLCYAQARLEPDDYGRDKVVYYGTDNKGWSKLRTYGGKITENLVQAIARDCLAENMLRLDALGYIDAFHVHDEVVLDVPEGKSSCEEVIAVMSQPIDWAPGLPLTADAYETKYYRKD